MLDFEAVFGTIVQSNDAVSMVPFLFIAIAAGAICWVVWSQHQRSKLMRLVATDNHLESLSQGLPRDFPVDLLDQMFPGWFRPNWCRVRNVIGGDRGNDFLLAFDFSVGRGRNRYNLTMVARRSMSLQVRSNIPPEYTYHSSGPWKLVFPSRRLFFPSQLLEPAVIERIWELLA